MEYCVIMDMVMGLGCIKLIITCSIYGNITGKLSDCLQQNVFQSYPLNSCNYHKWITLKRKANAEGTSKSWCYQSWNRKGPIREMDMFLLSEHNVPIFHKVSHLMTTALSLAADVWHRVMSNSHTREITDHNKLTTIVIDLDKIHAHDMGQRDEITSIMVA